MPTAQSIIERALENIIVVNSHDPVDANDLNDGLTRLNAFIGQLNAEPQMMFVPTTITKSLTTGTASYTIGSGGDIDTTMPVKIKSAFVRDSAGIDFPLDVYYHYVNYDRINDKDIQGYPKLIYYARDDDLATIFLWPVPEQTLTLHMKAWSPLPTFSTLGTASALPPEYEDMLIYNLSLRLAPKYPDARVTPLLIELARGTMGTVERMNLQPVQRATSLPFNDTRSRYNITSDGEMIP